MSEAVATAAATVPTPIPKGRVEQNVGRHENPEWGEHTPTGTNPQPVKRTQRLGRPWELTTPSVAPKAAQPTSGINRK